MTQEDYNWLLANRTLMYSSIRMTPIQGAMIFAIYNRISPKPMNYTTCGSCVRNVVNLLKQEFEKYTTTK
jgi:hypothetical protein